MHYSLEGCTRTKTFEGLRLIAYSKDGDVWTIGYGHTRGVKAGQIITLSQAEEMMTRDIIDAENLVYSFVTVELNQHQFDACVDAAFNLGAAFFRNPDGTKTRVLTYINSGKFHLAAEEFLKWDHFRGRVLAGLLIRRTWEEGQFELPVGPSATADDDTSDSLIAGARELVAAAEGAD